MPCGAPPPPAKPHFDQKLNYKSYIDLTSIYYSTIELYRAKMAEHKVLGLVSGGKDSCFNLLHCVANGHEVVALGTLTPESGTGESFR